jgi:Na+-translocating ferredoxin:NAD+ oxidoreductase subunit G
MKGNAKLGLILAIFAAVGCACLAGVYAITKNAIAEQSQKALTASLKEVFPEAESFDDITSSLTSTTEGVAFEQAFLAKTSLAPLGVAIRASGSSYGGTATLLIGVGLNRSIAGVRILDLNDTPGLGMNAKNSSYYVNKEQKLTFPGQFTGKFLTDAFEVKKDVAAITASTITSRSLTTIVKAAATSAAAWLESSANAPAAPADQATSAQPAQASQASGGSTGGK